MTTTTTTHKAQIFDLDTPLLSDGKASHMRARSELMTVMMKCHAEGGENSLHCHASEDHTFVVLQGEVTFHIGREENPVVLRRGQGMLLPMGTYYRFESTGEENLVQLRVGASNDPRGLMDRRDPSGAFLDPHSEEDHYVAPVTIPGKVFQL